MYQVDKTYSELNLSHIDTHKKTPRRYKLLISCRVLMQIKVLNFVVHYGKPKYNFSGVLPQWDRNEAAMNGFSSTHSGEVQVIAR
jgi:hypothetical protein